MNLSYFVSVDELRNKQIRLEFYERKVFTWNNQPLTCTTNKKTIETIKNTTAETLLWELPSLMFYGFQENKLLSTFVILSQ